MVRSPGVINIHQLGQAHVEVKVQIVLRLYDSPTEVLLGFDVDSCCCAFDGKEVWVTPRCIAALQSGMNILNPLHAWPNKAAYELRLAKYAARGFAVWAPGIDTKRVDYYRIGRKNLSGLKGMARFLKICLERNKCSDVYSVLKLPRSVTALRQELLRSCTEDEKLVDGMDNGYDDMSAVVLVPTIYGHFGALDWNDIYCSSLRDAAGSTMEAWSEILDASGSDDVPDEIPKRLEDAWTKDKKSREYLNAQMDKIDLDNLYYSEAYAKST